MPVLSRKRKSPLVSSWLEVLFGASVCHIFGVGNEKEEGSGTVRRNGCSLSYSLLPLLPLLPCPLPNPTHPRPPRSTPFRTAAVTNMRQVPLPVAPRHVRPSGLGTRFPLIFRKARPYESLGESMPYEERSRWDRRLSRVALAISWSSASVRKGCSGKFESGIGRPAPLRPPPPHRQ
jgi:hypothetical protein